MALLLFKTALTTITNATSPLHKPTMGDFVSRRRMRPSEGMARNNNQWEEIQELVQPEVPLHLSGEESRTRMPRQEYHHIKAFAGVISTTLLLLLLSCFHHDPPVRFTGVSDSSHNQTSEVVNLSLPVRAYEKRPFGRFPCFLQNTTERFWSDKARRMTPLKRGFFFLKTHKTGSSTAVGVHLRITHRFSDRVLNRYQHSITTSGTISINMISTPELGTKNTTRYAINANSTNSYAAPDANNEAASANVTQMCQVRFDHVRATQMKYGQRLKKQSFLWTILRDPTRRAMSHFFHFRASRKNESTDDEHIQNFLLEQTITTNHKTNKTRVALPYYLKTLKTTNMTVSKIYNSSHHHHRHLVEQILNAYDFIAITERMDESVVVLQMLLGLSTADVLYLNAKRSGGYDAGGFQDRCVRIVPKTISPGMTSFFQTSTTWKTHVAGDELLYRAANASLDYTIDQTLGRAAFEEQLANFQRAKAQIDRECLSKAIFPCSTSREGKVPLPRAKTDCLWKDSGCGSSCLDDVAEQMGI